MERNWTISPLSTLSSLRMNAMLARRLMATTAKPSFTSKPVSTVLSDILIVGAGPAGLTLASAIKNSPILQDLKCTLVESSRITEEMNDYLEHPPKYYSNRCVSITPATIDYLKKIGTWNFIKEERIQNYDYIRTYDGISGAAMDFEAPNMGTLIENYNLQAAAYKRVLQLNEQLPESKLIIKDGNKVTRIMTDSETGYPVVKLANDERIKTRLLIGCDGGRSPVRKFARIPSRGWAYNRWGVVGTLKYKDTGFRSPTGWQRFLPTGPLAQLPMPNNYLSIVWSVPPELAMIVSGLTDNQFVLMLNAASRLTQDELEVLYKLAMDKPEVFEKEAKWRLDLFNAKLTVESEQQYPQEIESIVPNSRGRFPLKLSHADDYVDERVALVGDAAHTTHPLAGQGLNMGQADVQCLVKTLETASERGLDYGTKFALDPYFSNRYPVNNAMLGVVDKIHKIYGTDFSPVVCARSLGVNILNNLPFVKDLMVGQVSHRELEKK